MSAATAASMLAALSFASLCLCSEDGIVVQPFVDGCGLEAGVEAAGDGCFGPCIDVRIPTAAAVGDDRPSVATAVLVAAPARSLDDRPRLTRPQARPRDRRGTTGHFDHTILRC